MARLNSNTNRLKGSLNGRIHNDLSLGDHRTYGVHNTDPYTTPPADHRVDFCVTYDQPILPNPQEIVSKVILACRCALAIYLGSRTRNLAAIYLFNEWLPQSGACAGDFPMFFHYVNVGLHVQDHMVSELDKKAPQKRKERFAGQ